MAPPLVARVLKQPASAAPAVFDAVGVGAEGQDVTRVPTHSRPLVACLSGGGGEAARGNAVRGEGAPNARAVVTREAVRLAEEPVRLTAPPVPPPTTPQPTAAPPQETPSPEARRAEEERAAAEGRAAAVEAARAEAYEAGLAAGRAEAEAALRPKIERLERAVGTDLEQLEALWHAHLERVGQGLVALAVEVAETLVAGPVPEAAREAADRAVVQAVEGLARGEGLSVRLHPVDYLRLDEAGLVAGLNAAHPALRWTPDDGLAEGDWVVESAAAAVRSIRTELLDGLRARLDLIRAIEEAPEPATAVVPAAEAEALAALEPPGLPSEPR